MAFRRSVVGKLSFRKVLLYYTFDVRSCPVFVQIPTSPPFNILEAESLDCGPPLIFSPVKLFESLRVWSFFSPVINSGDFSMEDNPFNVACTLQCCMYFILLIKREFQYAYSISQTRTEITYLNLCPFPFVYSREFLTVNISVMHLEISKRFPSKRIYYSSKC